MLPLPFHNAVKKMNYSSEISARTDKDSTLSTIYKQNQKEMALLALQTVQTSCVLDQFFAKTGCPGLSYFLLGISIEIDVGLVIPKPPCFICFFS